MSKKTIKLELITKVKYKGEEYDLQDLFDYLVKKIDEKENIIKEVKEYINNHQLVFEISNKKQIAYWFDMFYKELLEILDKENKE